MKTQRQYKLQQLTTRFESIRMSEDLTTWKILQTMHEGTKTVKINKLQHLTTRFESIRMSEDESFDEFYAKLNDIVNYVYNLGEIYDQPKIVNSYDIVNSKILN